MGSVRVLVVDDYAPWRCFVRSALRKRPEFEIVGEASDGLEAVQRAQELRPDVILLDIGLPSINGIETARQLHRLSPESKILFVSQESSAEVVEEALSTGACAYVVKANVSDLLNALNSVLVAARNTSSTDHPGPTRSSLGTPSGRRIGEGTTQIDSEWYPVQILPGRGTM